MAAASRPPLLPLRLGRTRVEPEGKLCVEVWVSAQSL